MGVRIQSVWGIRIRGIWQPLQLRAGQPPPALTAEMSAIVAKAEHNDPTWKADAQAINVDLGCVLVAGLGILESGAA